MKASQKFNSAIKTDYFTNKILYLLKTKIVQKDRLDTRLICIRTYGAISSHLENEDLYSVLLLLINCLMEPNTAIHMSASEQLRKIRYSRNCYSFKGNFLVNFLLSLRVFIPIGAFLIL